MYGYVYKTTNLLNDRIYIGQRKGDFDRSYLGSGLLILKAIKKYGRDNFAVIMLAQAHNKTSLDILEKYYIAIYKKELPDRFMYNVANGGQGGNLYHFHKEDCNCFRCRSKRGESKGEKASCYGKFHSEETKQKMRHPHKISEAGMKSMHRPRPKTEQWIEKQRLKMIGKRYSNEVNKKKGLSGKLNPMYRKGSSEIAKKGWETRRHNAERKVIDATYF